MSGDFYFVQGKTNLCNISYSLNYHMIYFVIIQSFLKLLPPFAQLKI